MNNTFSSPALSEDSILADLDECNGDDNVDNGYFPEQQPNTIFSFGMLFRWFRTKMRIKEIRENEFSCTYSRRHDNIHLHVHITLHEDDGYIRVTDDEQRELLRGCWMDSGGIEIVDFRTESKFYIFKSSIENKSVLAFRDLNRRDNGPSSAMMQMEIKLNTNGTNINSSTGMKTDIFEDSNTDINTSAHGDTLADASTNKDEIVNSNSNSNTTSNATTIVLLDLCSGLRLARLKKKGKKKKAKSLDSDKIKLAKQGQERYARNIGLAGSSNTVAADKFDCTDHQTFVDELDDDDDATYDPQIDHVSVETDGYEAEQETDRYGTEQEEEEDEGEDEDEEEEYAETEFLQEVSPTMRVRNGRNKYKRRNNKDRKKLKKTFPFQISICKYADIPIVILMTFCYRSIWAFKK